MRPSLPSTTDASSSRPKRGEVESPTPVTNPTTNSFVSCGFNLTFRSPLRLAQTLKLLVHLDRLDLLVEIIFRRLLSRLRRRKLLLRRGHLVFRHIQIVYEPIPSRLIRDARAVTLGRCRSSSERNSSDDSTENIRLSEEWPVTNPHETRPRRPYPL